ncbi:DUF6161 domain-containing protein [Flavilitoribacter nigricans]|uniref:DUF6161 domain-containing protein n=1 Tax=Flavilitoribacter nigricans (strain ATCC 23147 / DSM 23189 / NBRC 102662 / NCIMB 1420 / SS-2) TaxID=1122177 RepID=A0A2D0MWU2_FLAN2|nr:DUF6161 domain-containing protein [Flavilitoribacter nigricans]PHN00596.1 hypothetical protein CRP01_41390 [Flavilitoribacter nigricans DSM 23189 = NBRC 102662]
MNTKDFIKQIADAKGTEWFNNIEVIITYSVSNFSRTFKGLSSVHRFLSQQFEGWQKVDSIPRELYGIKVHFGNVKQELERFLNEFSHVDPKSLGSAWRLRKPNFGDNDYIFTYDSPEAEFLIDLHRSRPKCVSGAYHFMIGAYEVNNHDDFIGAMLAYEFRFKDSSEILSRRKKERSSITKSRNDFVAQLSDLENQAVEQIKNTNQKYEQHVQTIEDITNERKKLFDDWFKETKNKFSKFDDDSIKNISDLKKTYQELLRLKAPAEYWNKRAKKLKMEGIIFFVVLAIVVGIVVAILYGLLWQTPEGMLLSFKENQSSAIKWSIVYITLLSFLAYVIRIFHRAAFSSFHLSRDAEEREQLTYVYLSLIKDSAVDKEEKHLIFQSLFSRADTGLLKEDSSPTMPNDIAGKIFGR